MNILSAQSRLGTGVPIGTLRHLPNCAGSHYWYQILVKSLENMHKRSFGIPQSSSSPLAKFIYFEWPSNVNIVGTNFSIWTEMKSHRKSHYFHGFLLRFEISKKLEQNSAPQTTCEEVMAATVQCTV